MNPPIAVLAVDENFRVCVSAFASQTARLAQGPEGCAAMLTVAEELTLNDPPAMYNNTPPAADVSRALDEIDTPFLRM